MSRKLALKRLRKSDLSFFRSYFQRNSSSKQKAFNLNASILVSKFFPKLSELNDQSRKIEVSIGISGPGLAKKIELKRKISKGSKGKTKNWRLGGELVGNGGVDRFVVLKEGDIVLFEFFGNELPREVNLSLIAGDSNFDAPIFPAFSNLLGDKSMVAIGEEVLESTLGNANLVSTHPILDFWGYQVRPAGRHMYTIGAGLIKDNYSALIELVKNAYDADAGKVWIKFKAYVEKSGNLLENKIKIEVIDDGHGMSFDTVTKVWLVPSTSDKLERRESPGKGRKMQGRKGIGRYAAMVLGNHLEMSSVRGGARVGVRIDWREFESRQFLDQVRIPIETSRVESPNGTHLTIVGEEEDLADWDDFQVERLIKELRRLLTPFTKENVSPAFQELSKVDDVAEGFQIYLEFDDFPSKNYSNRKVAVAPFSVLEHFDYRIHGTIDSEGNAQLEYENPQVEGVSEKIHYKSILRKNQGIHPGKIALDIKVFDRDGESIEKLIKRGFKDPNSPSGTEGKSPIGKREARHILNTLSGIGIYRNGFRIRPFGDAGYDWLNLDKRRLDKPTQYVGLKQVIGLVGIEDEDISMLVEKSSREGLKENKAYLGLYWSLLEAISHLELRRLAFKRSTGKGRNSETPTERLQNIFDFREVSEKINESFRNEKISEEKVSSISKLLEKKSDEGNRAVEAVKKTLAIYQSQVTLGKIVRVVLHEGRNPLHGMDTAIPVIEHYVEQIKKGEYKNVGNLIDSLGVFRQSITLLKELFGKIDPLAQKRRARKSKFNVKDCISSALRIFSSSLENAKIKVKLQSDDSITFLGWNEDFLMTFLNLIDNSIYWLEENPRNNRIISIRVRKEADRLRIDFHDNGPGISEKVRGLDIFEVEISGKVDGRGLGLPISGEAMKRNGMELRAEESGSGAHFVMEEKVIEE